MADTGPPGEEVSHGLCDECREYFFPGNGEPQTFLGFLDRLAPPVLVVDADVRIIAANGKACALLRKKPEEIVGQLGGNAIECRYSRREGGCGQTVHCKSCTIRMLVHDTFTTGRSRYDVPAYPDSDLSPPGQPLCFLISSIKAGNFVVVRITLQGPD
jgi:PAS domain-containing protein